MTPEQLATAILKKIDLVGLKHVAQVYPQNTWQKFYNAQEFAPRAAEHALRLDAELQPGSRCLDLGCGFGYVALALEILGHNCAAWDAPSPVLRNVAHMIPVKLRIFRQIKRGEDLAPELTGPYDLIFLHGVWPMRDSADWYAWHDYVEQAGQLATALAPGGRVEILVNRGDELEKICNAPAWELLARNTADDLSATVADNCITIRRAAAVAV